MTQEFIKSLANSLDKTLTNTNIPEKVPYLALGLLFFSKPNSKLRAFGVGLFALSAGLAFYRRAKVIESG